MLKGLGFEFQRLARKNGWIPVGIGFAVGFFACLIVTAIVGGA